MPVAYQVSTVLGCVIVNMHGTVTDEELRAAQRKLYADADYKHGFPHLVHALCVTDLQLTAATVRHVAHYAQEHGLRRAALVTSSEFIYGMMRMYEEYASQIECHVTRDIEEALHWLLDPPRAKAKTA